MDIGLKILEDRKIVKAEGDNIELRLYLDDGSAISISSRGQEKIEVTRTINELVTEKKMVTKDLV